MKLNLTVAVGPYDRVMALQDGSVVPEGIDVNFVPQPNVGELFRRQARHAEFDVAEFSLSTYTILHGQGDRRMIAIPVFPSKVFRHGHILVNANAGIEEPKDLIGKRFGAAEYQQTAAIWQRAFLQHDYGVQASQSEWYFGMLNQPGPYAERIPVDLPADIRTHLIPEDKCLDGMLESGEIDALMAAGAPHSFLRHSPNVRRLFPDHKAVEADYYRRTGIFPIMHTLVIKREIYERAPWVARSLYDAFDKATAVCDRILRLQDHRDHRARCHEAHQGVEERALLVDGVERARLDGAHPGHLQSPDRKAGAFEMGQDASSFTGLYGVRLDDS